VFLEKELGKKGICSTAYTKQVLDSVIRRYYDSLTPKQQAEFIFTEDGAKVHKVRARL
jgi:hypothetical protein